MDMESEHEEDEPWQSYELGEVYLFLCVKVGHDDWCQEEKDDYYSEPRRNLGENFQYVYR